MTGLSVKKVRMRRGEVKHSGKEKEAAGCAKGFTGVDVNVQRFDESFTMLFRFAFLNVNS